MKKRYYTLALLLLLSGSILEAQAVKVVAYLPTWAGFPNSINNVQLTKVTHINVAFANPNTSGAIILADSRTTTHLATVVTKAHASGVKVFLSIGGAGAPAATYKTLLSDNTKMNSFVTSLVTYCTTNNLDGIDVDIEGDVLDGTNVTKTQYQTFVTALATALHNKSYQMTAALATWFATYVSNAAAAQFDWINLMSYDSALPSYPAAQHSPFSQTTSDFTYWNTTKGVPGSKLVIGVPFYGYGWGTYATSGELSYANIVATYSGAENNDKVGSGSNVIYYNGITTIKQKTTYACSNAAGVMIWQITEDATGAKSLLTAINDVIALCSVGIEESNVKNSSLSLSIYPNPSNASSNIQLNLPTAANTTLTIYDNLGQVVEVINNAALGEGTHLYNLNASSYPAGIYFCKLNSGQESICSIFIKN
ncbi:MAG: glycosyl hydrolase family 18 protein [Bacteroidetes bacterium]|nr:glycosyl hydrolase family 18 protein [Bacteroidota bacterium]